MPRSVLSTPKSDLFLPVPAPARAGANRDARPVTRAQTGTHALTHTAASEAMFEHLVGLRLGDYTRNDCRIGRFRTDILHHGREVLRGNAL